MKGFHHSNTIMQETLSLVHRTAQLSIWFGNIKLYTFIVNFGKLHLTAFNKIKDSIWYFSLYWKNILNMKQANTNKNVFYNNLDLCVSCCENCKTEYHRAT